MSVESGLRRKVAGWMRENGFFVQPIETGAIVEGVPDLWYQIGRTLGYAKASGWLELKLVKEMPKKTTTSVFKSLNHPLSNEQCNWIDMCRAHGGRADILVGFGREYFFVPGSFASVFNEFTEAELRAHTVTREELIKRLRPLAL
jgi:hypothetical protein